MEWAEKRRRSLAGMAPTIATELEQQVPKIVELIEEGERQGEIRRQEYEERLKKWQREEEEKRRLENIKLSRQDLFAAIEAWGEAARIEAFFKDAALRAADLGPEEHQLILDRVRLARELLGGVDALQRFREWQAPEER